MNNDIIKNVKYDIVHHCNLNCKNCGHFSPFKKQMEISIDIMEHDFNIINKKIQPNVLRLLGGEPLLHSNINKVAIISRQIMGEKCDIIITTNGIKIPDMSTTFFLILKGLNIKIEISKYPTTKIDYDKIESILKKNGITYNITSIQKFFSDGIDVNGKQNPTTSFNLCRPYCMNVVYSNGFIYLCPFVKEVNTVNSILNCDIEQEGISIDKSIDEIIEYTNKPCKTCKYCKSTVKLSQWELFDSIDFDK